MSDQTHDPREPTQRTRPERLGVYRVEEVIGAGGMGVVYRAVDEALARTVALKTLLPALTADPEFVARFKREAQSAAALNHPNITQIYAIGEEGSTPFFAMEWIQGKSLEGLVKEKGALDPLEATRYIRQSAEGLRHAASKDLIHRDVKPSNLMLADDGVVKITDFGLAKAARSSSQLTATGEVLGSPGYISPEQAQGGTIDARSDIYSLGATFYHLVTGKLPFDAPTPVAMIIKHMNEPLRSPRAVNPAIPYSIAAVIQRMMAKRPAERFQDYDALLRELDRASGAAAGAGPHPVAGTAVAGGTRPARPAGRQIEATSPPDERRSISWVPMTLMILLGAMIVAGLVRRGMAGGRGSTGPLTQEAVEAQGPIRADAQLSFPPVSGGPSSGSSVTQQRRSSLQQKMHDRFQRRNRPNLTFLNNDHEILPDGRLRVFGEVRNSGGSTAAQARVRVRVVMDNGRVAAVGEGDLMPSSLPPGGTATYSVPVDYDGPVGTIRAELRWVD